jgi:hypothetical protein
VHGDEFVADEVVSRREAGGDSGGPDEGVEDGVAGPDARVLGAGDEALLVDLDCWAWRLVAWFTGDEKGVSRTYTTLFRHRRSCHMHRGILPCILGLRRACGSIASLGWISISPIYF